MSDFQRQPNVLLQQRLARDSVIDPVTGCILWMASRGPISPGLYVLHRCDVRPCINPDHLFLGTQKDTIVDMYAKRGHERRPPDGGPERRPSKAPEIMRVQVLGQARILEVRPLEPRADDVRSEARLIG